MILNGFRQNICTTNRMVLIAINDQIWRLVTKGRHNFPSPLDEKNLAP